MGRSAGRQLAEKGANVIIVARSLGPLQEAKDYIAVRIPRQSEIPIPVQQNQLVL